MILFDTHRLAVDYGMRNANGRRFKVWSTPDGWRVEYIAI